MPSELGVDTVLAGGVQYLWGLQESSGSTTAGDVSGAPGRPLLTATQLGTGGTLDMGTAGIMPEGTAALFTPDETDVGGIVLANTSAPLFYLGTEWTLFAQFAWGGGDAVALLNIGAGRVKVLASGSAVAATFTVGAATQTVTRPTATGDNRPHFVAVKVSGGTVTVTVDDDSTSAALGVSLGSVAGITVGSSVGAPHQVAWVGFANAAFSTARIAELAGLATGAPEGSGARVSRILGWLGLAPDALVDDGLSDVAYQACGGRQALDVIAEANEVEQGVFFPAGDGMLVQRGRERRYNLTPSIVLTATEVNPDLSVAVDLARVVNDVTASRPAGRTYRARNEDSIAAYGPRADERTLYAASDDDLVAAADWLVNRYGVPAPRIPSVTVNLLAADDDQARSVLGAQIGDMIQILGMPATTPGGTTVNLIVEGVEESLSATDWRVTFATSPAGSDSGAWVLDDAAYSLLGLTTIAAY